MAGKIQLSKPLVTSAEESIINKVIKSHFWASGSGVGYVKKFENSLNKFTGSNTCIGVNSGTAALNLALSLFNLKNKEVLIPSLTFVSTAHAVILNGAKPTFVDVNPDTLCLDEKQIQNSITKNTKAIIPVHFAGFPCNLTAIRSICKKNNLYLIEDAAHAIGSTFNNKKIGAHGDAVCFSFHPVKNLAMPTGGAITINHKNHKKFRKQLESRRWCGISDRNNVDYDVHELGWNYYMNEFSAAIGLVQLKKLNEMIKTRKRIAKFYDREINLENKIPYSIDCSYHLYWILVENRKQFRKKLANEGIETGTHYKPVHHMSYYKNKKPLPITEKISNEIVTIPIHPNLTDNQLSKIVHFVNKFS
tara:strand:- start:1929 stop:3014 length:1086 start_codon:yes stop_codon:yes gene_type:complete